MEGIIISDYFGSNNDNFPQNKQITNDKKDKNEIKENVKQEKNKDEKQEEQELNKEEKKEEKKEENQEKQEKKDENNNKSDELPGEMEIIRTEKTSKIIIPEEIILEKQKSNELTQKLVKKTKKNSKMKLEEFFTKKRHFLIMSDGGKPVYSRYGDPIENNSIFATLSLIIKIK